MVSPAPSRESPRRRRRLPMRHFPARPGLAGRSPLRGPGRPSDRLLPHRGLGLGMALRVFLLMRRGPSRNPAGLAQQLAAVDPHLIQFEQLGDRFWIPLAGRVQKPAPLIQLFFFRVRCRSSFHILPALSPPQSLGSDSALMMQNVQIYTKSLCFSSEIGFLRKPGANLEPILALET